MKNALNTEGVKNQKKSAKTRVIRSIRVPITRKKQNALTVGQTVKAFRAITKPSHTYKLTTNR